MTRRWTNVFSAALLLALLFHPAVHLSDHVHQDGGSQQLEWRQGDCPLCLPLAFTTAPVDPPVYLATTVETVGRLTVTPRSRVVTRPFRERAPPLAS